MHTLTIKKLKPAAISGLDDLRRFENIKEVNSILVDRMKACLLIRVGQHVNESMKGIFACFKSLESAHKIYTKTIDIEEKLRAKIDAFIASGKPVPEEYRQMIEDYKDDKLLMVSELYGTEQDRKYVPAEDAMSDDAVKAERNISSRHLDKYLECFYVAEEDRDMKGYVADDAYTGDNDNPLQLSATASS